MIRIMQTEIHTAEPLVLEPSACEVGMAIEKQKVNKSPGTDQIPADLVKAVGRTIRSEILFGIRRNCLKCGMSRSFYLFIRRVIKEFVVTIEAYHFCQLYKIVFNILLSRLTPYAEKIIGDHQCGFQLNRSTNDHIFCICQILE
jgi:hypothetical protein